ncbi:MAG: HAMP domain-containing histidine kinase [Nitrosopumilus sp.]|nr:HAMP domain-containing histidine kinase [Nitrosopumilus sp.]MDH3384478.1 HAMP domain-containing histidine kinase [Nitrosopumilus sp.]
MGLLILLFSVIVSVGTLLATFHVSKNLTKPIETLVQRMQDFSQTNIVTPNPCDDGGIQELHILHKNFEEMANKVGETLKKEKQLNIKLKEIDTRKTEFMSMISHELKTPIMPIMGYIQLLKKEELMGELNEKQMNALNEIAISTERLQKIIQDILTAQKIDLGKLSSEKENVQSRVLVENAYRAFYPYCKNKDVQLTMLLDTNDNVYSDPDRVSQVFSNLISNALAFLPEKNGTIKIGTLNNSDENVTFYVQDNGIGISDDQQKNIFKKFYQVDTSSKRKKEGSGLGLSICEGIIKNLGGRMWVKSTLNQGTTFFFDLPKAQVPVDHLDSLDKPSHSNHLAS